MHYGWLCNTCMIFNWGKLISSFFWGGGLFLSNLCTFVICNKRMSQHAVIEKLFVLGVCRADQSLWHEVLQVFTMSYFPGGIIHEIFSQWPIAEPFWFLIEEKMMFFATYFLFILSPVLNPNPCPLILLKTDVKTFSLWLLTANARGLNRDGKIVDCIM